MSACYEKQAVLTTKLREMERHCTSFLLKNSLSRQGSDVDIRQEAPLHVSTGNSKLLPVLILKLILADIAAQSALALSAFVSYTKRRISATSFLAVGAGCPSS